jgi:hypothetical protein
VDAVIEVDNGDEQTTIRVTDSDQLILELELCIGSDGCIPGAHLKVSDHEEGIFPDADAPLTRDWSLNLLGP